MKHTAEACKCQYNDDLGCPMQEMRPNEITIVILTKMYQEVSWVSPLSPNLGNHQPHKCLKE